MKSSSVSTAAALAGLALSALFTGAAETLPQRTVLESAYAEFWTVEDETFFVFKSSAGKRVTLTGTNLKIVCDHLEMTAVGITEKGDKDPKAATLPKLEKFKYLLATGNVHIAQGTREAQAGRAEVFPREEKVVLSEKPQVVDHAGDRMVNGVLDHSEDHVSRGSKITMLRGQQKVIIEDSEFEGPAIKDLGFDKNEPPPTPPPPEPAAPAPSDSPALTVPGITPPQK